MEATELLKKLISIRSISGEEKEIADYIFNLLSENGFNVKKYPVDTDRFNIVADLQPNPKIFFQAHMDTVPPFLEIRENDENIYGRGTCDTKGSIASMICAGLIAKEKGLTNFGFIFTVGEETTLDGAEKLSKEIDIPFVIVGEPTSLDIVNEHFGLLVIKATAKGKAAHSSRPEEGINAINILIDFINNIKTIKIHEKTLINLALINGGIADNIVPEKAEVVYSFRISPEDNNNYFDLFSKFENENIILEKSLDISSVSTQVPKELDFIKTRRGVKYFTELSMFGNGVVIGPGDIKYAHGSDEQVSKIELNKAVEVYLTIIKNFAN